jgi:hypothetical protein
LPGACDGQVMPAGLLPAGGFPSPAGGREGSNKAARRMSAVRRGVGAKTTEAHDLFAESDKAARRMSAVRREDVDQAWRALTGTRK